jgi:cysteine desulfurase
VKQYYLDYAASAPLCEEAKAAQIEWLDKDTGNPSSLHSFGRRGTQAVDIAREIVSQALGVTFGEIIFTSSGTEAANLAVVGAALANKNPSRNRILLSSIEHVCVLDTQPLLERLGYEVELVPCGSDGVVSVEAFQEMMDDSVLLVALMHANNETGAIQPVREVSALAKEFGALSFVDAVQSFGKIPVGMDELGCDLISISAHKVGGPKGVGALAYRAGTALQPILLGGGQEREMRAGTISVELLAGFGAAVESMASRQTSGLREAFLEAVTAEGLAIPTEVPEAVEGIAHVRFPGISNESMLIRLDQMGIAASAGAACSSGSIEPSHVLLAMDMPVLEAKECVRFSFGHPLTVEDVQEAGKRVNEAARSILSR